MELKKSLVLPGQIYYAYLEAEPYTRLCNNLPDYLKALDCIRQFSSQTNQNRCRVLAYCLLPDSWHLIYVHDDQASAALQDTFRHYRRMVEGHSELMTHRFSDPVLIQPEKYLADAVKLVHWLPVLKKQVAKVEIYPWSSHFLYAEDHAVGWVDTSTAKTRIANHRHKQQHRYHYFMQSPPILDLERLKTGNHPEYLAMAGHAAIERLLHPESRAHADREADLERIIDFICTEFHCKPRDLKGNMHHRFNANLQSVVGSLALNLNLATLDDIAMNLDLDPQILEFNIRGYSHQHPQQLEHLQNQFLRDN